TFNIASGDVAGLIAAIDTANANGEADTINLAAGTYTLTTAPYAGGNAGLPTITSEIAIIGAGAATTTIERAMAAPSFRIFTTSTAEGAHIEGLTLYRGNGAISNSGKLKIKDCVLSANSYGVLAGGQVEIEDSTVTGSTSLDIFSGAIVAGNVTIRGSQ